MTASTPVWRTSSRSNSNGGNCVEVADELTGGSVGVRDSKDRQGPVLAFDPAAWRAFIRGIATR
jgi:hypothetical protein